MICGVLCVPSASSHAGEHHASDDAPLEDRIKEEDGRTVMTALAMIRRVPEYRCRSIPLVRPAACASPSQLSTISGQKRSFHALKKVKMVSATSADGSRAKYLPIDSKALRPVDHGSLFHLGCLRKNWRSRKAPKTRVYRQTELVGVQLIQIAHQKDWDQRHFAGTMGEQDAHKEKVAAEIPAVKKHRL